MEYTNLIIDMVLEDVTELYVSFSFRGTPLFT